MRQMRPSVKIFLRQKEMNGKYQVGSGRIVAITHDIPFIGHIILRNRENVKQKLPQNSFRGLFADFAPPLFRSLRGEQRQIILVIADSEKDFLCVMIPLLLQLFFKPHGVKPHSHKISL